MKHVNILGKRWFSDFQEAIIKNSENSIGR